MYLSFLCLVQIYSDDLMKKASGLAEKYDEKSYSKIYKTIKKTGEQFKQQPSHPVHKLGISDN